MDRRDFLRSASLMSTASLLKPELVFGRPRQSAAYFDLHPFVSAHPEAVLIEYRLPQAGDARIEIYNTRGQLVEVLADRWHAAGSHVITWDAGNRASGTYFYRFLTHSFQESRKMLLVH